MNAIAIYWGDQVIYWSSVIITLGILCCLTMTLALYRPRSDSGAGVWAMFPLAFLFSVVFSRLLHWYFNSESYGSFARAFTDFSVGSFCIPGVILGVWLAAWLVHLMRLSPSTGLLLDCTAPGMCLLIALIRLSSLFNDSCRSRIIIDIKFLQHFPLAVSSTDAAGNETWRMATFFIAFVLMIIVMLMVLDFYVERGNSRMVPSCPRTGHVWRMFLVYYAAVEAVMDSTRYDSPLMHFHFISYLNQYSAFISLAQVFGGFCTLGVLIYYTVKCVKGKGFKWYIIPLWLLYIASLVGIGYLGEYQVQRTAEYLKCYAFMSASCVLMVLCCFFMYRACVRKRG